MCTSFILITEVPFYILCHHYNFVKLYPSVDSHIFLCLFANKNILNLNKAMAMWFSQNSQNKAWYPILNPGGVLSFELGMDVRPEVSTTTL